jgi:hypothetical protein
MKRKILNASVIIMGMMLLYSCSQNSVQAPQDNGTVIFQKSGLVDSVYVTCCCTSIQRFISDTLTVAAYSKIKITFDGRTNSDGSMIDIYYNTENSTNNPVFTVRNQDSVNGFHTIEINKPANRLTFEIRNTIFPPVCGENECKYTRSRDFVIYGIK